jgi:cellobiose phosphorylase
LNFALPLDEERHAPDALCSAPYAITNCYQLVPSFRGRAFFSFLTGSVAMIGRAIYGWMVGVQPTLDTVDIKPCIPERYRDSECELCAGNTRVKISYRGYGNRVVKATLNDKELSCDNGYLSIAKDILYKESLACIDIEIE